MRFDYQEATKICALVAVGTELGITRLPLVIDIFHFWTWPAIVATLPIFKLDDI